MVVMTARWYARGGKRLLDVVASGTLLAVGFPVIATVATVVRAGLGSPVLFRQRRPGRAGRPFTILKFRTMTDARAQDGTLLSDAQRLTPLGRWLRRTSLDELPELLNVLRGDMSLVGPRPLLERYRPHYTARERTRENVRPGITGLAQVTGRNLLDWTSRLEADARYVESQSLGADLRILAHTVRSVARARGVEDDPRGAMLDLDAERAVRVETLGPQFAEALVRLHRDAFDETNLHTTIFAGHGVARYYADVLGLLDEHRAFGALSGDRLVGYAHVRKLGDASHLNQIATAPIARQRGVGGRLLDAWVQHARAQRCHALTLDVREGSAAHAWYRRRGFESHDSTVLWQVDALPHTLRSPSSLDAAVAKPGRFERYGFDTIQMRIGDRVTQVGRLGDRALRVEAGLPDPVLRTIRRAAPHRHLLIVGGERAPHHEARRLHTVVRMQREVA